MADALPKAQSVTAEGELDGWLPQSGWRLEASEMGRRLVVSTTADQLSAVHRALVEALGGSIGVLYRKKVDRREPKPNGWPGQDYISLDVPAEQVLSMLDSFGPLFYTDARHELWLRGSAEEQLVMDQDGVLYVYPGDDRFITVLEQFGMGEIGEQTLAQRDYVKHWYRAECDELEDQFRQAVNLTEWG